MEQSELDRAHKLAQEHKDYDDMSGDDLFKYLTKTELFPAATANQAVKLCGKKITIKPNLKNNLKKFGNFDSTAPLLT